MGLEVILAPYPGCAGGLGMGARDDTSPIPRLCGRPGYGARDDTSPYTQAVWEGWVWGPCGRAGYGGCVGGLDMGASIIESIYYHYHMPNQPLCAGY